MNNKNKVLLLSKYPRLGASSRLRFLQYLPFLEKEGFEFTVESLFDEKYLEELYTTGSRSKLAISQYYMKRLFILCSVLKYDLIWIEKELFPYFPAIFERVLDGFGIKYIVDYDDAVFHNYDISENRIVSFFLPKKIDKVMRYSKYVIVGNEYLASRAKTAGAKRIKLIPTVVDHVRYEKNVELTKKVLTVGWIGSPSTQKYVVEILSSLLAAHQKIPFRLLLVGASPDLDKQLPGLEVEICPWDEVTEIDMIGTMDIGIMPLHDGPWEKGKCGYKLIQYMACGVTVIASPIGVNKNIIEDSNAGFLAETRQEWIDTLLQSLESFDIRNKNGIAGRKSVEKKYSLKSQVSNMNSVLKSSV